jgi:hypothetical protein
MAVSVKFGRTEVKKVAAILDQDWDSAEQAAEALLTEALAILEARGKLTVVGQLRYSRQDGGWIDPEDAAAAKVCLGLFSTQGDADKAAYALTYHAATGEEWRTWVLPVDYRTPSDVTKARQEQHRAAELEAKGRKAA